MSITRSQIARQLLAEGGSPGNTTRQRVLPRADGKRPGYYGSDAGFGSDDYKDESASFDSGSGSGGSDQDFANARAAMNARTASPTRDEAIQNPFGITRVNRNYLGPRVAANRPPPPEFIEEEETPIGVRTGDVFPGLDKVTARDVFKVSADNPMLHRSVADKIAISMVPGIGKAINLGERFAYDLPAFRFSRTGGKGPTIPTGSGDSIPMPMMPFRSPQVPSDIESRPSDFDLYAALEGREASRFGASPFNMTGAMQRFSEGGEVTVNDAEKMALPGESLAYINEDEAALLKALGGAGEPINQTGIPSYFLKKIFRKAKGAVKKITKSKLGKAALAGAALYGGAKLGGSSFGKSPFSGIKRLLVGSSSAAGERGIVKSPGLLQKLFLKKGETDFSLGGLDPFKVAGVGLTAAPFLFSPDEEDEETLDQAIARSYGKSGGIDIPGIRKAALGYSKPNELYFTLPEAFRLNAADGGLTTIERAKQLFEERQRNLPEPEAPPIKLPSKEEKAMQKQANEAMMEGVEYFDPKGNQMTSAEFQEAMRKITEAEKARDKKAEGGTVEETKIKMLIKKGADNDLIKTFVDGALDSEIDQIREQVKEIMRDSKAEGGVMNPEEYFKGKEKFMKQKQMEDMIKEYEKYLKGQNMKRDEAAEGGLMDLGGKEMDLRGGGFVPLGAKEKADDVPARLSKNEFVFTADAVRAAGGGSVDKGAQKMYNTMKQLENKI
jgi:hypothetical protein